MRPRWRKVLKDLWTNYERTALVVLSITIGVFAVGVITGLYVIIIDPNLPDTITIKYEIHFTIKKDSTIHYIDPYLKIR